MSRVALVTGGASGIGAAVVRRLANTGYRVVVADVNEEGGRAVAKEADGLFVRVDVADLADNEAAVAKAVEAFGPLDVVHLNAGISSATDIGAGFDLGRYRAVVGVNLDGIVFGIHAALPHMRGGGSIIVTSSMAGVYPWSPSVFYATTKGASVTLVRALAPHLPDNITVNAICPSFVDTPMIAAARDHIARQGRMVASPDLVADAVEQIIAGGRTGQAWIVQAELPLAPVEFPARPSA
jgi:NAD(P)-dependent dehydrogenase (short-subunit alcohol dehydrogenase family)